MQPLQSKVETPVLLSPLMPVCGAGRLPAASALGGVFAAEQEVHGAEAWNNACFEILSVAPDGRRRPASGRRRSMAEIEAEFERSEPFYSLPLKPPAPSSNSTADAPNARITASPTCVTSPYTGGWLRSDELEFIQELVSGGPSISHASAQEAVSHFAADAYGSPQHPSASTASASALTTAFSTSLHDVQHTGCNTQDVACGGNITTADVGTDMAGLDCLETELPPDLPPGLLSPSHDDDGWAPPPIEALLRDNDSSVADDPCSAANHVCVGTSSRRLLPGRTMVMLGKQRNCPSIGILAVKGGVVDALRSTASRCSGRPHKRSRAEFQDGYDQGDEPLFLDVAQLVPESDLVAAEALPTAYNGPPAGYSTRPGGVPRRAAALNRRPASALLYDGDSGSGGSGGRRAGRRAGEYAHITQDMLKDNGYFDMPIQEAAAQLGIGLSVLKRVCRTIGLARWPFRKRQSLRNVVEQTKLYLNDMDFASKGKVLRLLEEAAASLDGSTGEDLGPAFKRYRQAVFKLNYKINKLNSVKRGVGKGVNGESTKVAIPKSAAASLEALANFALDAANAAGGRGNTMSLNTATLSDDGGDAKMSDAEDEGDADDAGDGGSAVPSAAAVAPAAAVAASNGARAAAPPATATVGTAAVRVGAAAPPVGATVGTARFFAAAADAQASGSAALAAAAKPAAKLHKLTPMPRTLGTVASGGGFTLQTPAVAAAAAARAAAAAAAAAAAMQWPPSAT